MVGVHEPDPRPCGPSSWQFVPRARRANLASPSANERATTGNRASGPTYDVRGIGLATGLAIALFPTAVIDGGLQLATGGGGAILGAVAGHAGTGMSRSDPKDMGENLDSGQAGLVVVAVSDMEAKVKSAMKRSS